MASFDRVISISKTVDQYVNKNYQRYLKKPPRLIYEGSDEKFFHPKFLLRNDYKDYFYEKLPNLKNKKIITYPGKLSSWGGQESFIKLLSDLPNDFAGLILGAHESERPKHYKSLEKLIEEYNLKNRVYFYEPKEDTREVYFLSEVILSLSSKPEAFGMKLLEAAMMEKKIAGWDHGGSGEILEMCFPNGKVEFNNFDLLAQKIKELASSDEVPKNIFLTSNLLHQKTVAFYIDALNKNN
jgi:glycosyltransferase involved in cell wall biosynthesis